MHSGFEDPALEFPEEPLEPWFDQPIYEPWGEWNLRAGDIVRMFAVTDSYFPGDYLRVKWETEPPGVVHFLGDMPFMLKPDWDPNLEEKWIEDRLCDPYFPGQCGSHYFMEAGSMEMVTWTEMVVLTDETFDLVLTVDTMYCDRAIRVVRFNK